MEADNYIDFVIEEGRDGWAEEVVGTTHWKVQTNAMEGGVKTEVLAQQRQLMASTTTMLPPFGQQPASRRRLEDIV